jgi:hypothetical protein
MECIRAFRRQPPQAGAQILAFGALKKIRVGDFHYIRRPPREIAGFDKKITFDRFHTLRGFYKENRKEGIQDFIISGTKIRHGARFCEPQQCSTPGSAGISYAFLMRTLRRLTEPRSSHRNLVAPPVLI